ARRELEETAEAHSIFLATSCTVSRRCRGTTGEAARNFSNSVRIYAYERAGRRMVPRRSGGGDPVVFRGRHLDCAAQCANRGANFPWGENCAGISGAPGPPIEEAVSCGIDGVSNHGSGTGGGLRTSRVARRAKSDHATDPNTARRAGLSSRGAKIMRQTVLMLCDFAPAVQEC